MQRKTAATNTISTSTEISAWERVKKVTIKKYIDSCPNHFNGRKSNIPDVIVLHNTGGSNISSAHWWFLDKTSQTSAHFLVGLDGEIRQYVNLADGSYCNGTTTDHTKKHYYGNATNGVIKTRSQNANLYTVSIECVGNVGDKLTSEQLEAVVFLIKYIRFEIKRIYLKDIPINRLHIIGHYEIVPLTRGYCGKNIQYDEILNTLNPKPFIPEPVIHKKEEVEENPKTSDIKTEKTIRKIDIKNRKNLIK